MNVMSLCMNIDIREIRWNKLMINHDHSMNDSSMLIHVAASDKHYMQWRFDCMHYYNDACSNVMNESWRIAIPSNVLINALTITNIQLSIVNEHATSTIKRESYRPPPKNTKYVNEHIMRYAYHMQNNEK